MIICDWATPWEQSDLGPYCLQYRLSKKIKQTNERADNKSRNWDFILSTYNFFHRYHLGSLAFGSLLIAIVQIIRVGLEYIDSKLKGSENAVAKFLLK